MAVVGYGFWGFVEKQGDNVLRTRKLFGESVSLTTSRQTGSLHEIPAVRDVVGIAVEINASLEGTLSGTPKTLSNVISRLDIVDAQGESITEGIGGEDIKNIEYFSTGKMMGDPFLNNIENTLNLILPVSIDAKNLPAKVQVEYEAYDTLDSQATGGSANVNVWAIYRGGGTNTTYRVRKSVVQVANGTNSMAQYLPRQKTLNKLGLKFDESKFSEVVFSRDGSEEYRANLNLIEGYMNAVMQDGYRTGLALLDITPADITDKTVFDYKASGSDTVSIYAFLRD